MTLKDQGMEILHVFYMLMKSCENICFLFNFRIAHLYIMIFLPAVPVSTKKLNSSTPILLEGATLEDLVFAMDRNVRIC